MSFGITMTGNTILLISPGRCAFHSLWRWRKMIVTSVSTCGLQRQSNKGKLSSNEVVKSPRLQIEHMNSHDKRIQTRTFQVYKHPLFVTTAVCRDPQAISTIVNPTNVSTRRGVLCPLSFPCPNFPYIPPPHVNRSPFDDTAAVW